MVRVFGEMTDDDKTYEQQYASNYEEDRPKAVLTGEDASFGSCLGMTPGIPGSQASQRGCS